MVNISRVFIINLLLLECLFGGQQLKIANHKWQLIGLNGAYVENATPPIFGTSGNVFTDSVDANGTVSYFSSTNTAVSTLANSNTVGILAIKDTFSPSGNTKLIVGSSVSIEVDTLGIFDATQTRYRMYLAGASNTPAIRIDFQSNLLGKKFKVRFGSENNFYIAYFNADNTFDSPQKLSEDFLGISSTTVTSKIIDVFDINFDNNLIRDIKSNRANALIEKINALANPEDVNLTVYELTDKGVWGLWDSRNSIAGSNGFSDLTPGRGYWVYLDNSISNNSGFILGDQGINDSTNSNFYNGWNLVSFRDSNIRYSPTGFFIPMATINANAIKISYKDTIDEVNIPTASADNTQAARVFNWNINALNVLGSSFHARAYPARSVDAVGAGVDGIVVISDDRMDINSNAIIVNIFGQNVQLAPYGTNIYTSNFGQYMMAFELNDLFNRDINQTVNFYIPSRNPNIVQATDLNDTNLINVKASRMLAKLNEAGVSRDPSVANALLAIYAIDTNSTNVASYDSFLIGSNVRFSIQDGNFVKTYKRIDDGPLVVSGTQSRKVSSINNINSFYDKTNVRYLPLANNNFMITSNKYSNLDLLEDSGYTMLLDNPTIVDAASKILSSGAIKSVYTHLNLLSPDVNYNDTVSVNALAYNGAGNDGYLKPLSKYTNDLKGPSAISLDFPSNGPLNELAVYSKTISQILSADTIPTATTPLSQSLFWQNTDLTKDPKDWFDLQDTQEIFTIKKEKGYWVNIKDFNAQALSVSKSSRMSLFSYPHFDNNITSLGGDKIALVTNHINHILSLKINGLDPIKNMAYDVSAIIRGRRFPMISSGSRFILQINDTNMNLQEATEGNTNDDSIKIQVFDGLGNFLVNNDYVVNFIKPSKPKLEWKSDGELKVTSKNDYNIYNGPILDTSPIENIILENSDKIYASRKIKWSDSDGNVTLLRVVAKKKGVYSDVSVTPFVPFKDSHILQVRNRLEVDKIPFSYITGDVLRKNNQEIDNGVQITSLQDSVIMISYRPEVEGVEQLSTFGGTTTMYLKVNVGGATTTIGYITYIHSYREKYFYVYYNDQIYQCQFSADNSYAIENKAYNLSSGVFDFSNLALLGNEGNRVEFSGYSANSQPIFEPKGPLGLNNNINAPSGQQPLTGGIQVPQPILPNQ